MNKIFKVVWSKVKHCYVVVSEVAKNVIKGSVKSAKIGATPMTRGLALGAMMAFVITGNVWAEGIIKLPTGDKKTPVKVESFKNLKFTTSVRYKSDGTPYYYVYKDYNFQNIDEPVQDVIIQTNGNFYFDQLDLYFWAGRNALNSGILRNISLQINNNMYFGGYIELVAAHAVNALEQTVYNNNIIIQGNTLEANGKMVLIAGFSNVGSMDSLVIDNHIIISGTELSSSVNQIEPISLIGGKSYKGFSEKNTVELNNVKFKCGDSKIVKIQGGFGEKRANNNAVYIKYINADNNLNNIEVYGGYSEVGEANENIVDLSNVALKESVVYGGCSEEGNAKDNIATMRNVTINNSYIYGGYSGDGGIVAGNILNVVDAVEGAAKTIGGFATINYDNLEWNTKVPVLKTTNLVLDSNRKITANVNGLSNGSTPKKGEVMTLLDTGKVMLSDDETFDGQYLEESKSTFSSGDFLEAEGKIYQEAEDIKLKITRVGTNDQALVIGESRAAATAFANQGSELIEIGLDSLARDKSDKETKVFASVFGNASEYATGSHVKVNGWSGIVGVAKTNDGGITTGAFFENGEGNYRTFNNFEGFLMRGDGEANYNGGGFFARKDNANGVYTEASLRAGNLQNELRKAVITDSKLEGYDIDTFYYGAHVGAGRIIPRGNEGDSIDVYGKFIYTHHDSEDFTVGGDNFHFDSIDSERLRLGFRINEVQNDKLSMYYGAAWEYEFNGDANNTVIGYDISTPSLGGSTVIGEIGAHYKANEKWNFDLNCRAYSGQRDGFTGSIQANYLF